jgi:hypothetical protein
MHLATGEGGERALFAVLSGKIEVVKLFDGVERTLGWRFPGTIFGEVPLALGSPFPGGYRASEPSRDMRLDPVLESSVPGVFACGDVRLSPVKRVASAVGEGSMAIAFVHKYLQ